MKIYRFYGTDTTLSDMHGEIRLNKPGQEIELDEDRAAAHIASGAPLQLVELKADIATEKEHE